MELPVPYGDEAVRLIGRKPLQLAMYAVLYEAWPDGLTIREIEERTYRKLSERREEAVGREQQNFSRRLRAGGGLRDSFVIPGEGSGNNHRYRLVGLREDRPEGGPQINKTLRSWVLRHGRCAQCGRTPEEDDVKLHVDHKLPQNWGGNNEPENLQALCSECNEGKKNYFSSMSGDTSEAIRQAASYDSPHMRIGEALKAAYPEPIRTDILETVASAKTYQEDWQKRCRELRFLGWHWSSTRRKGEGRTQVYYVLDEWPPPWPEGDVGTEIRRIEKDRSAAKRRKPEAR